jgi:hypothetical protein
MIDVGKNWTKNLDCLETASRVYTYICIYAHE